MREKPVNRLLRARRGAVCVLIVSIALSAVGCKTALESMVREAGQSASQSSGTPTQAQVAAALREALSQGVESAVDTLGRYNGFYENQRVRIPLPEGLRKPADLLRRVGQDRYVDEFVQTMNRAAERAVPEATSIFLDAIRRMSLEDAMRIVRGPDDAATSYFRETAGQRLTEAFRPVVGRSTDSVRLTQTYKNMLDRAGPLSALASEQARDLDGYITSLAINGVFTYIAEEEKRIRENPVARSTELLKRVFGYFERT